MNRARSTAHLVSAADQLRDMQRECARTFGDALRRLDAGGHGPSLEALGASLGVSASRVSQWKDDAAPQTISVAYAALLPLPVRIALAELIAGDGYMCVSVPDATDAHDVSASASLLRASAETACEFLDAARDGVIDRAEGARVEESADGVARIALGLRELGRKARREGVIGIAARALRPVKRAV